MSRAYYNERDPYAARWLRNLIAAGHIVPGDVDERDIRDVKPNDLDGYTQCHFFAGIGVWSLALRRAGWPDSRPVWTGSCPCQPFSTAGRGAGVTDERHLWPHWLHLISQRQPGVIFGEQVEAAIKHGWLDLVQTDLEGLGYAVGAVGVPIAGVGGPHIRQRLWFVADSVPTGWPERRPSAGCGPLAGGGGFGSVGNASGEGLQTCQRETLGGRDGAVRSAAEASESGGVADAGSERRQQDAGSAPCYEGADGWRAHSDHELASDGEVHRAGPTNGFWRDADWLLCRDGKWRPVEPGTFPLANGAPARVGRLRAYGNAISPQAAEAVIRAYLND